MTILETLKTKILNIVKSLNYPENGEDFEFNISYIDQVNNKYGDIATNIVLILAKKLGKNPKDLGKEILKEINLNIEKEEQISKIIEKAELANNGFINFFLKDEFIIKELNRLEELKVIETIFTKQKVLIEHSSPNLFKPFHIGHLMNNIIGEAIVKMM